MPFRKKYQIKYLATTSLNPNPCSAPKHSDKQIAQRATNIEQSKDLAAIVLDVMLTNIADPETWIARQRRRYPGVPAIGGDSMNEKQRAAFALAGQRLWDILHSVEGRI